MQLPPHPVRPSRRFWHAISLLCVAALPATGWALDGAGGNIPRADLNTLFPDTRPASAKGKAGAPSSDAPVSMEADAMGYDKDNQIAVAIGHVVVVQGDYVLNADKLTYFQASDRIEAVGNVSVLQPSGDVFFAERADVSEGIKRGVAYAFKARLADDSVMAAAKARKVNDAVMKLDHAVYSPCHVCENLAPFWQIKSSKMKVDQVAEKISYDDPRLEMFGVPIAYAPYAQGPTPNAAAQSGFLPPTYTSSNNLGTGARVPYYIRLAHDKDLLLTPWIFSNENPLLAGEYRQLTDRGSYNILFSGTNPQKRDSQGNAVSGNEFRGHIAAQGMEELTDDARVGFDINRASDQTYLARYNLGNQQVLFSRLYAESAQQRNMASVEALSIQGLRTGDDAKTTPFVAPMLNGYYETEPMDSGLRLHASGNMQNLSRQQGADQRRLSATGGATVPYITENGQVLNASASVRQDVYEVKHVAVAGSDDFSGSKLRTIPQTALQWRYPLIRSSGGNAVTVEPLLLGVARPTGGNSAFIDNEDSKVLELSDTNLFDIDRVPGYDVIDSGGRMAYGVHTEAMLEGGEILEGLLGQNYTFDNQSPFVTASARGKNSSDIIGRTSFTIAPLTIGYRFALNQSDLNPNRSQLSATFSRPWLTLTAAYNSLNQTQVTSAGESVDLYGKMPLTQEWSLYGSGTRDLQLDRMVSAGGGAIYHNECFDFVLDGLRRYTHDRDVASNTSVTFRVAFKNLGVFGG